MRPPNSITLTISSIRFLSVLSLMFSTTLITKAEEFVTVWLVSDSPPRLTGDLFWTDAAMMVFSSQLVQKQLLISLWADPPVPSDTKAHLVHPQA